MSITPEVPAKTFTELVARQIRIAMAIENIRQSEVARRMNKTEQWVSVRLRGRQPIDVNDMLLFARALGVGVHQLMPSPEEAASAAQPGVNLSFPLFSLSAQVGGERPLRISPFGGGRRDSSRPASAVPATKRRPARNRSSDRPGSR